MKNATAWVTPSKQVDVWAVQTRRTTAWAPSSAKVPSLFTASSKALTNWLATLALPDSYVYSSATLAYNSAVMTYDFVSAPPANSLNLKLPSTWSNN